MVYKNNPKEELKAKLRAMSYMELINLEDSIILPYEALAVLYITPKKNNLSEYQPGPNHVRWFMSKAIIASFFLIIFGSLTSLFLTRLGNAAIVRSIIIIFIVLFIAIISVFIADLLWQVILTPFIRSMIRSSIHYWPATLSLIYILKYLINFKF